MSAVGSAEPKPADSSANLQPAVNSAEPITAVSSAQPQLEGGSAESELCIEPKLLNHNPMPETYSLKSILKPPSPYPMVKQKKHKQRKKVIQFDIPPKPKPADSEPRPTDDSVDLEMVADLANPKPDDPANQPPVNPNPGSKMSLRDIRKLKRKESKIEWCSVELYELEKFCNSLARQGKIKDCIPPLDWDPESQTWSLKQS